MKTISKLPKENWLKYSYIGQKVTEVEMLERRKECQKEIIQRSSSQMTAGFLEYIRYKSYREIFLLYDGFLLEKYLTTFAKAIFTL